MTKFKAAIVGGGIAGLCLAAELLKEGNIQVDVYEASEKFGDIGAGITLWGRVCEALRLMDLENDCIKASLLAVASAHIFSPTTIFSLRGFRDIGQDFGSINFEKALRLSRVDFLSILLCRIPASSTHLGKRLQRYAHNTASQTTTLKFSDGTTATCDVLIGCDGIRSPTRTRMIRAAEPRWSGTVAYRISTPISTPFTRNQRHSMLTSGQIYCGKNKHVVGYPISHSTLSISMNITDPSMESTQWPSQTWAHRLGKKEFAERIAPFFVDLNTEVRQIIETTDSAIQWAMHDLEPLPFYVKGRVALVGDAAHASLPYLGLGVADAIEDAYVLSQVLCADVTTRGTLPLALKAYQTVRLPHGNNHILGARKALRAFQCNSSDEKDMARVTETIRRLFERADADQPPLEIEAQKAISWLVENL